MYNISHYTLTYTHEFDCILKRSLASGQLRSLIISKQSSQPKFCKLKLLKLCRRYALQNFARWTKVTRTGRKKKTADGKVGTAVGTVRFIRGTKIPPTSLQSRNGIIRTNEIVTNIKCFKIVNLLQELATGPHLGSLRGIRPL